VFEHLTRARAARLSKKSSSYEVVLEGLAQSRSRWFGRLSNSLRRELLA